MATRLKITLPDLVAEKLRAASGNSPSEYIARAVIRLMMDEDLRRLADFETRNPPDPQVYRDSDAITEEVLFGRAAE
ncbi:hypothetical protein [Nocardia jejuensis]|uniref:hypothetical protein n=1 Tax=Nocardia jejuensis TaxID=328049 RepID=UPI00082C18D3|nr:hypothetical protein [Nocardia jejuensis]